MVIYLWHINILKLFAHAFTHQNDCYKLVSRSIVVFIDNNYKISKMLCKNVITHIVNSFLCTGSLQETGNGLDLQKEHHTKLKHLKHISFIA